MRQKTIGRAIEIKGKALHSGRLLNMTLAPAPAFSGIQFLREDQPHARWVRGSFHEISSTELSTTLGRGVDMVGTVEHLMAACFLLGVDNLQVTLNGPEVPILDGSAQVFMDALEEAGLKTQEAMRHQLRVLEPFRLEMGDQWMEVAPSDRLEVECTIEFPHKLIGKKKASFRDGKDDIRTLGRARTFCHLDDVNAMRQRGLALGGSLQNAVVVSDKGVMNEEGLRSSNEFAEHKLLDLLGDLYLLGSPLVGKIKAYKPGHSLHAKFMRALSHQKDVMVAVTPELLEPSLSFNSYAFG